MTQIIREFITAEPTQAQFQDLHEILSSQSVPLLHSTLVEAAQKLNVPLNEGENGTRPGELFFDGNSTFHYYLKFSSGLEIGSMGTDDIPEAHDRFMKSALTALPGERRLLEPGNRTFSALIQDYGSFTLSDEDLKAAQVLADPAIRKTLHEIVAAGRKELAPSETKSPDGVLEQLQNSGLIKGEVFIFCRETGKQIMMVESMDAILEASRHGFKCFTCGRSFSEENLTQFVGRTPLARKLMHGSRWLTILVVNLLEKHLPSRRVCPVTEKEVTTLFFSLENSLMMIELKESPYRLDDAYLLSKKIEIYNPAACFLLHLSLVPGEVSEYLVSSAVKPILSWGNSLQSLEKTIPEWMTLAAKNHVDELLRGFTELSAIPLDKLAVSYLFSQDIELPEHDINTTLEPQRVELPPQEIETAEPPAPPEEENIQEEPPTDLVEVKNAVTEKILLELSGDISGRQSTLHVLFQDLAGLHRRWKVSLHSEDGLVVASTLDEEISEALASFGGECYSIAGQAVSNKHLGPLLTLMMASRNFSVELYHVPGFYLSVAANLESLVSKSLSGKEPDQVFKKMRDQLLAKKHILSVALQNKQGEILVEGSKESASVPDFALLRDLFPKLSSRFGPLGQGPLETIAVRTAASNLALTKSKEHTLGVSCNPKQIWEDLFPALAALTDEASLTSHESA